jgi:hypothetical protein
MNTRKELFDSLLSKFIIWKGKNNNIIPQIQKIIDQNKQQAFFHEVIVEFKMFINSRDCTNEFRYEKKTFSYLSLLFRDAYYVVPTQEFKEINILLDNAIIETKPLKNYSSIINEILSNNYWMFFLLLLPKVGADILTKDNVLNKIDIDESYKKTLSLEQIKIKKESMADFIMNEVEKDPVLSNKITDIWESKNFSLVINKKFEENPFGVGVYSTYRNKVFILEKENYFCTDYSLTFKHELQHASHSLFNSKDPIEFCKGKTEKDCDILASSFNSLEEQQKLYQSLKSGEKRITKHLKKLHKKFKKDQLTDENERVQYNQYVNVLSHYQPRCIAHLIPFRSKEYTSHLKLLNEKKPIPGSNFPIYPIYHSILPYQGTLVFGNFIKNEDSDKVMGFIKDTQYIFSTWIRFYNDQDLITKELDAEIHGDHSDIVNTFYPEVVSYHSLFRKKYTKVEEMIEERSDEQNRLDL